MASKEYIYEKLEDIKERLGQIDPDEHDDALYELEQGLEKLYSELEFNIC